MSRCWVNSSRGCISRIFFTDDVACNKSALVSSRDVVDASENFICLSVPISSFPPAFNNSTVVTENPEVLTQFTDCAEGMVKKFEAHRFCPSNVSAVHVPARDELPGSPPATDNNADANTGTGIQGGTSVCDNAWAWDGAGKLRFTEFVEPPCEVSCRMSRGMMWDERIFGK